MPRRWQILDCTPCHVRALGAVLRANDAAELVALGAAPRREVWRSYRASIVSRAALVDGEIAAAWGVCGPLFGPIGVPWLLTAPAIERVPWEFAREARREARELLGFFPVLANRVHARYTQAVGFLEILGFDIGPPEPYGSLGESFHLFSMTRA